MTQQSESAMSTTPRTKTTPRTTTRETGAPTDPSPFAPPFPPLTAPRPLGERRVWPRTFHDRLTAPLPGFKTLARFAREGSVRPGREGLAAMLLLYGSAG
ncbi:hypothetical protein ADL12_07290 [Streptomyces regalis]|uniref:Uncharacterized protein n=1 Tax=Streptomyces regalis TaxID=68262 RepID=A0A0X3VFU4_9ACTN|nr:hypothetical protein ADL12_07290 [Streptomyces regalis]